MGHTYTSLLMHVIFSTKNRRPTLRADFRQRLYEYMNGLGQPEGIGEVLNLGGTDNHLHGLLGMRPDISPAEAMMRWKSLSSGWVHKTIPDAQDFGWQVGYAMLSIGRSSVPQLIQYIERQEEHHRRQTFEDEFLAFLAKYEIEYDPKYVWD